MGNGFVGTVIANANSASLGTSGINGTMTSNCPWTGQITGSLLTQQVRSNNTIKTQLAINPYSQELWMRRGVNEGWDSWLFMSPYKADSRSVSVFRLGVDSESLTASGYIIGGHVAFYTFSFRAGTVSGSSQPYFYIDGTSRAWGTWRNGTNVEGVLTCGHNESCWFQNTAQSTLSNKTIYCYVTALF